MKRQSWIVSLAVVVAVAAVSFWLWRGMAPAALPSGILYANGHVEGTPVDVSAEVTARVLSTAFEEGDAVGAGDVLARLDEALFKARLAQARAELEALRAAREQAVAEQRVAAHHRRTAVAELERVRTLERDGQASRQQLDAARDTFAEAAGRLDALRARERQLSAEIRAAEQSVRTASLQLEKTTIQAPVDGTVLARGLRAGELASPGRLVARLVDLDRVELQAFVPESELGRLRVGDPARVRVSAFPERHFSGRVIRVDQEAQFTPRDIHLPSERVRMVFGLRIGLDNPEGRLKPGMPADAWIRWDPEQAWPQPLPIPR